MTNKQFDAMVRRQIEMEDIQMSDFSEYKLSQSLQKPSTRRTVRRFSARSLVLAALILALLCGAAVAAISWSSREFLSYTDKSGQEHANDALISLAQPVGKTFEGSTLRIDMVDAIFDGRSLIMAWTMQNKQSEGDVYLLLEQSQTSSAGLFGQGSRRGADEIFISPGEVISSGMSTLFDSPVDADTFHVAFTYSVLAPKGDVVSIGALSGDEPDGDAAYEAYAKQINDLNAQGKLVLAPDGVIELGNNFPENAEGMTRTELLVAAGKMELLETVEVSFTIDRNADVKNLLPSDKPIEQDNGDYILRVVKAELSANSATFELERVFQSQEAAERFAPYYTEKLGPYWGFAFEDETKSDWFFNGGGTNIGVPEARKDGTWVWTYEASLTQLQSTPKSITIIPLRDDTETGEFNIPYPQEAIVLQVP